MKKVALTGFALVLLAVGGFYLGYNGSNLAHNDQEESQQIIMYTKGGRMLSGGWTKEWEMAKAERIREVERKAQEAR